MPTVYFLCGMPTSGKTTLAKKLAAEQDAQRFTLDERMISKHDYSIDDEEYGPLAAQEKMLMWEEAQLFLTDSRNVVLDWSLWSRAARAEWTQRVLAAGYGYKLFYLDVPLDRLKQRATVRNADTNAIVHFISLEELDRFSHIFQPPSLDENLNFEVISS
ncbi:MAG: AAA family ATPase [Anaerolineae bacterium]